MDTFTIRPPSNTLDEYRQWRALWQGYLAFYDTPENDAVTTRNWAAFHDSSSPINGFAAFDADGKMLGMAQTVIHEHTWTVAPRCYLNDLFTAPEARGQGVARGLIEAVYAFARQRGCATVHWLTHRDNLTAQSLYNRLADNEGFIQYVHHL